LGTASSWAPSTVTDPSRRTRGALFRQELDRIAAGRGARVHYLVGTDVGPLTPELFHRLVPGLVDRDVYLCGPPGLSDAVRQALHAGRACFRRSGGVGLSR
jgi:ferredoxin-NADP reductase